MKEMYTFFSITPNGHQQMILANINRLNWERDCVREQLDAMMQKEIENGWEHSTVQEELETEETELTRQLWDEEKRHYKLMGFYSDGIPF